MLLKSTQVCIGIVGPDTDKLCDYLESLSVKHLKYISTLSHISGYSICGKERFVNLDGRIKCMLTLDEFFMTFLKMKYGSISTLNEQMLDYLWKYSKYAELSVLLTMIGKYE